MESGVRSVSFFDDRFPVKTVYTDNSDWQRNEGWQRIEKRNAVFQECLGTPIHHVFHAYQVDSGNVLVLTEESAAELAGMDKTQIPKRFGGYDAMVTAMPNIMLCICTADCLPLFLYDPVREVAAIAHCGWRGICDGIVPNTVGKMAECFDTDPKHVVAAFGPCICGKCYEVGGELKEAFARRFSTREVEELFREGRREKFLLDLRKAVTMELRRTGVTSERIHDTRICSYERLDYPSCRRAGTHLDAHRQTFSGIVLTQRME